MTNHTIRAPVEDGLLLLLADVIVTRHEGGVITLADGNDGESIEIHPEMLDELLALLDLLSTDAGSVETD